MIVPLAQGGKLSVSGSSVVLKISSSLTNCTLKPYEQLTLLTGHHLLCVCVLLTNKNE